MALKINFDGILHDLTNLRIDEDENLIILSEIIQEIEFKIEIKLGLDIKSVLPAFKNLDLNMEESHLFKNIEFNQARIVEFRSTELEGNGRLGYYFSLNSIVDEETNIFNDSIYTSTAAFRAIVSLLKGNTTSAPKIPQVSPDGQLSLLDFYKSDIIILVLANEKTKEIKNFDFLGQYMYPVKRDGFTYISDNRISISQSTCQLVSSNFASLNKLSDNLYSQKTTPVKSIIQNNSYLRKLILELIPRNSSHLFVDFHLLYQVIEIFIEFVLKAEIKLQLNSIDDFDGHRLKEKILELTSTKKRTNLLLNNYSRIDEECTTLLKEKIKPFCKLFMSDDEIEKSNSENLIIALRNILIHDYKRLYESDLSLEKATSKWKELIDTIEYLLIDIIVNFKEESKEIHLTPAKKS